MPASIRKALISSGLMAAYRLRPAYQRNDYLGWIERARLGTTRQRRLEQMLEELARGDRYMKMMAATGNVQSVGSRQNSLHR
jgi:hypothetical protein